METTTTAQTPPSTSSIPSARGSSSLVVPLATFAGLLTLLLGNSERRAAVSKWVTTSLESLGSTAANTGQAVASGTRSAAQGAQQLATTAAGAVAEAVKPLPNVLAAGVSSAVSTGSSAAKALADQEVSVAQGTQTQTAVREVRQALRNVPRMAEVQKLVETEVSRQLGSHLSQHHVELEQQLQQHFTQQDETIRALGKHLAQLSIETRPRRGGIPWRLLLLGGLGYYLWSNPQARQKVMQYVQQARPAVQERLQTAGQAVQQTVQGVQGQMQGQQGGRNTNSSAGTQESLFVIDERLERNLRERLAREGDHMQVRDVNGEYVGTVDGLEGDRLKLTRSGSHDGQHHYVPLSQVRGMDDVAVYLSVPHGDVQ